MILNIITPLTRLENITLIQRSIPLCEGINIKWHIHFDASVPRNKISEFWHKMPNWVYACFPEATGIAGHIHRNAFLTMQDTAAYLQGPKILDEWIMSLDDDNILHSHLIPWLMLHKSELENYSGVIFDQAFKNGVTRLKADPDKITVGNVDTAQYMFRGSIVKGLRFDETRYDADGVFIEELYARNKDKFLIVNQPLCYYNYLR